MHTPVNPCILMYTYVYYCKPLYTPVNPCIPMYTHVYSCKPLYYIKVSGIASGNKLIKAIRYPHMWRYDIFTCEDIDDFGDIKFVS